MKQIYITFIRSILEYSCPVWHSSLTNENREDIERIQKSALRIILQEKYKDYTNALDTIDLEPLEDRRTNICLTFAKKCVQNPKTKSMFPLKTSNHSTKLRSIETFKTTHSNTNRLKNSAIPYMTKILNEYKHQENIALR